jgi:hypothetical protein
MHDQAKGQTEPPKTSLEKRIRRTGEWNELFKKGSKRNFVGSTDSQPGPVGQPQYMKVYRIDASVCVCVCWLCVCKGVRRCLCVCMRTMACSGWEEKENIHRGLPFLLPSVPRKLIGPSICLARKQKNNPIRRPSATEYNIYLLFDKRVVALRGNVRLTSRNGSAGRQETRLQDKGGHRRRDQCRCRLRLRGLLRVFEEAGC